MDLRGVYAKDTGLRRTAARCAEGHRDVLDHTNGGDIESRRRGSRGNGHRSGNRDITVVAGQGYNDTARTCRRCQGNRSCCRTTTGYGSR